MISLTIVTPEKCYDLPGQLDLISNLRENTEPGVVAFQFSMNMESITLTLVPAPGSEGYLRLETTPSLNVIYVNTTLTINSLNPDLINPPVRKSYLLCTACLDNEIILCIGAYISYYASISFLPCSLLIRMKTLIVELETG